jgi:beta-glucosidase
MPRRRIPVFFCKLTKNTTVANFPYLVPPSAAIQGYVHENYPDMVFQSVFNDFNYAAINSTASHADVCMVFANADSGEQ